MSQKKRSTGELISTIVFFLFGLWLIQEGINRYNLGDHVTGLVGIIGGCLSALAAFRFKIQNIWENRRK
jgi:hypothetical protein